MKRWQKLAAAARVRERRHSQGTPDKMRDPQRREVRREELYEVRYRKVGAESYAEYIAAYVSFALTYEVLFSECGHKRFTTFR